MAFVLFMLMKAVNTIIHIGQKKEEEEKKEEVVPEPTKEEVLLTEIRDLLKAQNVNISAGSENNSENNEQ